MAEPASFRKGFENCRPRIRRYWRHLVFVLTPVSFLAGLFAPAAAGLCAGLVSQRVGDDGADEGERPAGQEDGGADASESGSRTP
jgi:hypothetical protein